MDIFSQHLSQVVDTLYKVDRRFVDRAVDILGYTQRDNGTVWLAGNGGSAATASHFANDLVKMCGLKAIALPDLTPVATAYGNDTGWDNMYANAVLRMENENDTVIGITCSGNSKNIVEMIRQSNARWKIVLTNGNLDNAVSYLIPHVIIRAHHNDIRVQEDVHSVLCHAIARTLAAREGNHGSQVS